MKWVIRGALVILALVILSIGAIFIMLATFDPNNYKDEITSAVKDATGRDLVIAGDIEATLFPVLGFEVSGVTLGNPPGFAADEFLTVNTAQAGVEIMPLLERRIELTKVVLTEPAIHVIKNESGQTNLTFTGTQKAETSQNGDSPAMDLSVGAIEINDAKVTYTDNATGKTVVVDPLNITLPGYAAGEETDVALSMTVRSGDSTMVVDGSAAATAAPQEGSLELSNLDADVIMSTATLKDDIEVHLSGNGSLNTQTQNIDLNIPDLGVRWQGTEITGNTNIDGTFSAPAARFSASASTVNLDELMAGITKDGSSEPDQKLLPVDMLRNLNMDGDINIQELVFRELVLTDVNARIDAQNGIITISPLTAGFYQGTADASVSMNVQSDMPSFTFKNNVDGVAIGDLLQAKMGRDFITGTGSMNFDLKSRGNSVNAIQKASSGRVHFDFREGYINKWQVSRLLNQAIAFFETGTIQQGLPDRIYFTAMEATFNGENGIFRNNDLILTGPKVHALGSGVVNLASQTVDYTIRAGLGSEPDSSARYIPISVSGPLSSPNYALDTEALVMGTVRDKIQDRLMEELGGDDEAADPENPDNPDAAASPEADAAKRLIEGFFGGQ